MESAEPRGESGPEQAAFGAALERFGQLLRAILTEFPIATGGSLSNQPLGRRLAAEFDRWLRDPASMPPWWQNLQTAVSFVPPPLQSGQPFDLPFGLKLHPALPLSTGNEFVQACRRASELMTRWSQLQAQLAVHWSAVARSAGEKFIARAGTSPASLDLTNIRKLYDSWIDCAEQAYAATVHTDEFCRTQAELVNITTALLLEQRRQVECLARMFGLPTRSEVDALRGQMRQMQDEPRPGARRSRSKTRRQKRKTG